MHAVLVAPLFTDPPIALVVVGLPERSIIFSRNGLRLRKYGLASGLDDDIAAGIIRFGTSRTQPAGLGLWVLEAFVRIDVRVRKHSQNLQ